MIYEYLNEDTNEMAKIVGNRLRGLRKEFGLTQNQVCKIMRGVSQGVYAQYEKGERIPRITHLYNIARHYNVSMDYICGVTSNRKVNFQKERMPKNTDLVNAIVDKPYEINGYKLTEQEKRSMLNYAETLLRIRIAEENKNGCD